MPEVVGVILQNAANAAIKATEWLINKGIDGINALGKNFGFAQIGKVALGTFKSASLDIAKQFDADQKRIEAETVKGMKEFVSKVAAEADKNFEKRQKATKGAQKATEDHTRAIELQTETVAAANVVDLEAIRISKAFEAQQKALKTAANDNIKAFDALGVTIPTAMENAAYEMERVSALSKDVAWGVEDIADAINRNDWTSAFVNLARVLSQVQNAFKAGASSADKFAAAAGLAQGIGSAIGGSTGSAIGATASGALTGFQLGGPVGAVIGGGIGLVTSLFGSSKAKKQQRAQEAAQRAAEEAARQQQISDTTFSLNVALLEAQGKAEEALAMTRQRELEALAKLDPALVALQQQLYAAEDAASAAAKEAEAQAQALQKEIAVRQTQRGIMLQLMALDDAVTGGNSAVLAARQDELAALDPVSRQLKEIYYARLDEGEALAKQAAAVEAATKAQEEAAQVAEAFQQANIGLMRQLMAMDDAVLGTTSARDAARADELAKLDETGRKLQTIIWARQDEAEVIAKQQAATEAATAAAEEAARKTAEILKQRTDLENQLLVALGMTALATERQRAAMLESLDPSLRGYQALLYGVEDATAAVTAAESALADARSAASQAYEREASALQATIDKFKSFSASLKSFRGSLDTGGLAMNDPMQQYARTKADFERVAGLAAAGNEDALGSLQGVSEAYLEASKNAQATNVGYFKDLAAVKRATEAAQKYADQQVDQNTAQLSALQSQVSALGILNQSTLSVGQAVTNVAAAIDALARATSAKSAAEAAAKSALSNAGVIPKATESLNDTSRQVMISANDNAALAAAKVYYNSANGGVDSALFNRYFANDPFGKSVGFTGDPEELRRRYGFATGGSFTVGGSGPPDSQVFPLHLSPGEMVNVSRPGESGNAELVAELRALRQEVAELKAAQIQTTINTGRQVRLAERWDGDGLPETRSVA